MGTSIRFSVGVCAHNEGTQPDGSSRLRTWLQHWKPLTEEIILILHDCHDDSEAIAAEFDVRPINVQISGLLEAVLWETPRYANPETWHIRTGGIDEFMSAEALHALSGVLVENDGLRLCWISRRNFCEGVDISQLLGPDWQLDLMRPRPLPIKFKGGIHSYPEIAAHASQVGMIDPQVAQLEHRRSFAEIVRCNRARNGFSSPAQLQMQEQFIARTRDLLRANGKEVAE